MVNVAEHGPGEPHRYRIECEVCGQLGAIRLTVDPETVDWPVDQAAIDRRLAAIHDGEPEGWHNPRDAVDGGHGER